MSGSASSAFHSRPADLWAPQLRELLERLDGLAYVAGGAARQLVLRAAAPAAEDIDLFLYDRALYSGVCSAVEKLGYAFAAETDSAMSFSERHLGIELPVQVIRPEADAFSQTYGAPEAVLSRFSFTTEMFAVAGAEAIVGAFAVEDTQKRRLVVNNVTDPVVCALRAVKYAGKGYWMTRRDMYRLFEAWSARPATWRGEVALANRG